MRTTWSNRDKRAAPGRRRYVRQVGDQFVLLPECPCSPRDPARVALTRFVCPYCQGADLAIDEVLAVQHETLQIEG